MDAQGQLLDELESVVERLTTLALAERTESGTVAAEQARRIAVASDRLAGVRLRELRTVVESGVWGLDGSRSPKAWRSRTTGCSQFRAGSDLKLAADLAEVLPLTSQALLAGACSLEQARALSTHTTNTDLRRQLLADPECGEPLLLAHTHRGTEAYTRFARRDRHHRQGRQPHCGSTQPRRAALSPATPPRQRPAGTTHGTRPTLVVGVPFDTLLARAERVGISPEQLLAGGPRRGLGPAPAFLQGTREPLPPSVLRKLACDSDVMRVLFGPDSEVIDIGRTQRLFTGALRRALEARGGCRRPGCDKPAWMTIGHHIVSWLDGGPTSLDNGMLTHGPDGALTFTGPGGHHNGTSYPRGPTTLFAS